MEKGTKEFDGKSESELDMLIAERCNIALEECEEYLEKEYNGTLTEIELRVEAEKVIYKKAVKDTFELLRFFQII